MMSFHDLLPSAKGHDPKSVQYKSAVQNNATPPYTTLQSIASITYNIPLERKPCEGTFVHYGLRNKKKSIAT